MGGEIKTSPQFLRKSAHLSLPLTCGQPDVVAHAHHGPDPAPDEAVEHDHQDVGGELDQEELGPVVVHHHVHLVAPQLRWLQIVISILLEGIVHTHMSGCRQQMVPIGSHYLIQLSILKGNYMFFLAFVSRS